MPHLGRALVADARLGMAWLVKRRDRKALRRAGVAGVVVLGHVLFLWLILAENKPSQPVHPDVGVPVGLDLVGTAPAVVAASAKTAQAQPRPQAAMTLDPIVSEAPAPQPDPAITDVAYTLPAVDGGPVLSDTDAQALSQFQPASAQAGAGEACNLTSSVVRDFSQSPLVRQGVDELPATEKSVANAVQMWDGAWSAETQSGGKALLRAVLTREIAAAPADCLRQANNGPVFFMVPEGPATVVVAVGSGQWTWGQLVE